jgi:hypothetical protein
VGVLGYYEHSRGAKIGVWCVCMRFGGNCVSECRGERVLDTRWLELHETRAMLSVCKQWTTVLSSFPETGVFLSHAKTTPSRTIEPSHVSSRHTIGTVAN